MRPKWNSWKIKVYGVSYPSTSPTDCYCDSFCVVQLWKTIKATKEPLQSKTHPQIPAADSLGLWMSWKGSKDTSNSLLWVPLTAPRQECPDLGQHSSLLHPLSHGKAGKPPSNLDQGHNLALFGFLLVCRLGELPCAARGGLGADPWGCNHREAVREGFISIPYSVYFLEWAEAPELSSSIIPADSSGRAQGAPLERCLNFKKLWEILATSSRSRTAPRVQEGEAIKGHLSHSSESQLKRIVLIEHLIPCLTRIPPSFTFTSF